MPLLRLTDGALSPYTDESAAFVPLEDWRTARDVAGVRDGARIAIANDVDVRTLKGELDGVRAIALTFPKFQDGRAYTQARLLRERLGFEGEIRATGDVQRDQALYMIRCGFNVLDVPDGANAEEVAAALHDFSYAYQPAADETVPVRRLRVQQAA